MARASDSAHYVTGPIGSVGNTIALFSGTSGSVLQDSSAVITSSGDMIVGGYISAFNVSPEGTGDVTGPSTSTDTALVRFDGPSGKLVQNSSALLSDVGDLSLAGAIIASNIPLIVGDVSGPAASTDNALVRFNGETGELVQNSDAILTDTGDLVLTGSVFAANVPAVIGDVSGPVAATDNALVRFDGTTGKRVQNSATSLTDSGDLALAGTITATNLPSVLGDVVGPAVSTPRGIAVFANSGGKVLLNSTSTIDASGRLTLTGGAASVPVVPAPTPTPLSYYEQSALINATYTGPWSGTVAGALYLVRVGDRMVMLSLGQVLGSALAAAGIIEALSAIPPNFRPTQTVKAALPVVVNGAFVMGALYVRVDGSIQVGANLSFTGTTPVAFTGLLGGLCGSMGTCIIYATQPA